MRTIKLKKGREASILRQHPWIFSGAILKQDKDIEPGEIVNIVDHSNKFIGRGHFESGSLAVKMLTLQDETIDFDWFLSRIRRAMDLRRLIGLPNKSTNAFRLIHGEGDLLPGLIIDVYSDVAVVQPHSIGMEQQLELIKKALENVGFKRIVWKPVDQRPAAITLGNLDEQITILEHGMVFNVDVMEGQKTGFFLDQRDNRQQLAHYSKNMNVLNVFSYTGGFSIAALMAGAKMVTSVDASSKALLLADNNAMLNGVGERHLSVKADAIKYLQSMQEAYDIIVLDPPAFAKHKSARHNAVQAYKRINAAALEHLKPGGLLFTFSCSQVIDTALFQNTLASAAIEKGVSVQVLHHLHQPADHPVHLSHPEGHYLKGLVVRKL